MGIKVVRGAWVVWIARVARVFGVIRIIREEALEFRVEYHTSRRRSRTRGDVEVEVRNTITCALLQHLASQLSLGRNVRVEACKRL